VRERTKVAEPKMPSTKPEPARILSVIIAALAAFAAAGGLLSNGPYRDNSFVTAAWRGNDLVTIVVALRYE